MHLRKNCKNIKIVACHPGLGGAIVPRSCDHVPQPGEEPCPLDPWIVAPDKSKYVDLQTLKLQENPEHAQSPKTCGNPSARNGFTAIPPRNEFTHIFGSDLTRNFLNGTIPDSWRDLPLVNVSVTGNRVTGQIPSWIGNITTLTNLALEENQFTGSLPMELGYLRRLEKMRISDIIGNSAFPQLKGMGQLVFLTLRNCGITGEIPNYIGSFVKLKRLLGRSRKQWSYPFNPSPYALAI